MEFFAAGAEHRERAAIGGNRIGKTNGLGGYETTLHLLGEYPDWWVGRRFTCQTDCWAAGDTSQTTRDVIQECLLGPIDNWGTGMIPKANIKRITRKSGGVPDAVESIEVQGRYGVSRVGLKSYDQKRKSFQGTFKHVVWLDEEPPYDVYGEAKMRILDTGGGKSEGQRGGGIILGTFTPLSGISDVVKHFLGEDLGQKNE